MKNISYIHSDMFNFLSLALSQKDLKKRSINDLCKFTIQQIKTISKKNIIFPTYNYNFTKTKNFDYFHDTSQVGSLSEYFRKLYKDNRSLVPVFSDCSNSKFLKKIKTKFPLGKNSVFEILKNNNSNIIFFGTKFAPSFIMHIEHCLPNGPKYRYLKTFQGKIKINKKYINTEIKFYCRPLKIFFKYDLKRLENDLLKEGILEKKKISSKFYYLDLNVKYFYEYSLAKLKNDPYFFLDIRTKKIILQKLGRSNQIKKKDFE